MPPRSKKRKATELGHNEMERLLDGLDSIKSQLEELKVEEGGEFEAELTSLIEKYRRKLEPVHTSFSEVSDRLLESLDITRSESLHTKDPQATIARSRNAGATHLMSPDTFHKFLLFLDQHVVSDPEASARIWIDVFMYRLIALTAEAQPQQRLLLRLDHPIPEVQFAESPTSQTVGGFVDYVAFLVEERDAAEIVEDSGFVNPNVQGMPVIEAKAITAVLHTHIPRAVAEIAACAKTQGRHTLRGALTNGKAWYFLVFTWNNDFKGGSYKQCLLINNDNYGPAFIASVLHRWLAGCFLDIGDEDEDFRVI
ncbi:hypothetical protein K435DRAFT_856275 [Dendrothele bispora CBS 962.96]|uniref:Uncharacterized protein n=1 Tax=Dendrothele bispora (strain CBS 962.96) TaxID=1314807 RepID=A0A4V4HGH0_DENBC|nr:hypothetical protein K435DRAFT_856275 [Dendrothele bispora CBS 962.96]